MTKEIEIFISLWDTIEPFFVEKEKRYVAVLYVFLLADYLGLDKSVCSKIDTDHYLSDALKDWFNLNEDDYDG